MFERFKTTKKLTLTEKDGYKPSAFGLSNGNTPQDKRRNLIGLLCIATGYNTIIGYEGIENDEDELYYLEHILKLIEKGKTHI